MAAPTNYEDVVSSAMERGAARPAASPIRHRFLAGEGQQPAAAPAGTADPSAPATAGEPAQAAAMARPTRRKLNLCLPVALYRRMRVRSLDLLVEGLPRTEASMSAIVAPAVGALLDELDSDWEPGEGLLEPAAGEGRKHVSLYLPEGTHSRLRRTAVDRACRHLPYSTCLDLVSLAVLRHVPEEGMPHFEEESLPSR